MGLSVYMCVLLEGRMSEQQTLSVQCERSSRNVLSLCDRRGALVLTCSALLSQCAALHKHTCNQAHTKLHTA